MPNKDVVPPPIKRSVLLKLKLQTLLAKLPSKKQVKETATNVLALLMVFGSLGYVATRSPELHSAYLRNKVGSKVYMIKGVRNGGGGTGFELKAPSGISYIITNSHVCDHVKELSEDKHSVLVGDDDGEYMSRKIIAISDETDLCLIESLPGVQGLSVGSEPEVGDRLTVVGHPKLRPLTLASGEMIGSEDVNILDFVLPTGNPLLDLFLPIKADGTCDKPKNEMKEFTGPDGIVIKACFVVTHDAHMTSITIFPGNSGSPVVDYWGKVVGVAFAASSDDNQGEIISLHDLTDFIARY